MVQFLTVVYLFYIFCSLYLLVLYFMIYIQNRKEFFIFPVPSKEYSLDMIIPCYNAEKTIENTINAILSSDYKGLRKIIVVDDCSTDHSHEIVKNLAKKNHKIMLVQTPKNTGKASGAKDYGVKFAKSEFIGFTDADSFPEPASISKMIGFFNEEKVGAVTSSVLVLNDNKLLGKLQAIEYRIIVFTRKILGFVDAIYVTPGPLAIYRKKIFSEIGGFDEKNLTEDIEITWNLASKGYLVRMSPLAQVYTDAPTSLKSWLKQRIRWNVGGLQTINKYKKFLFKKGMLGSFILPFFVISWAIGLSGLLIMFYRLVQAVIIRLLSTSYSIQAQTAILNFNDLNLVPNILFFFGIILLIFGLIFTLIALKKTRYDKKFKKISLLNLIEYSFLYVLIYPIILVISIYRVILKKENKW